MLLSKHKFVICSDLFSNTVNPLRLDSVFINTYSLGCPQSNKPLRNILQSPVNPDNTVQLLETINMSAICVADLLVSFPEKYDLTTVTDKSTGLDTVYPSKAIVRFLPLCMQS